MTENSDMTDISIDSISASLGIASFLNEQAISAAVAFGSTNGWYFDVGHRYLAIGKSWSYDTQLFIPF